MSGTLSTDSALVGAATSATPYATPTVQLNDALLQVPAGLADEMYAKVGGPEISTVTTKTVNGTGIFDVIMASLSNHLKAEYEKNRITGSEYTKAYTDMTQMALNSAIQFALGKEQAFWVAQRAQIDAVNGRVELEKNRVLLNKSQLETMTVQYNLSQLMPQQRELLKEQVINAYEDRLNKAYSRAYTMPAQVLLIAEQTNAQRAQTLDTRSDGAPVTGVMGSQKSLYSQQVVSYQRDSEVKAAKLFTDAWITQKTLDEGLLPPAALNNDAVNLVMQRIRTVNNML